MRMQITKTQELVKNVRSFADVMRDRMSFLKANELFWFSKILLSLEAMDDKKPVYMLSASATLMQGGPNAPIYYVSGNRDTSQANPIVIAPFNGDRFEKFEANDTVSFSVPNIKAEIRWSDKKEYWTLMFGPGAEPKYMWEPSDEI